MKLISSTGGYSGAKMQLDFMAFPYARFRINLLARSLFACGLLIAASVPPAAQPAGSTMPPPLPPLWRLRARLRRDR